MVTFPLLVLVERPDPLASDNTISEISDHAPVTAILYLK